MQSWWDNGWRARWGPWLVVLCIIVSLGWGTLSLGEFSWCHVRCYLGTIWVIPGALLCLAVVDLNLVELGMIFWNCGIIYAPVTGLLVSLGLCIELVQERLDINLVLDGHKTILEVLSEVQILIAVSLDWWLSASLVAWWCTGPLHVVFWIFSDPLAFARSVFLAPPIFLYILGFVSHSPFCLF